ncbi:MAG: hypothetical protein J6D06_08350 [Clostridia bacterium]|nr:hypothetical protein [Clostridia bacterium]
MRKQSDKNQYLTSYPKLNKWINECNICHFKGYDPQIDVKEEKIAVKNIKSLLPPLELNEDGICPMCKKIFAKSHNAD